MPPASKRKRGDGDRTVDTPAGVRDQEPEADDIDSSDVEGEDSRSANRYAHHGRTSIDALLENALAVRIQSKKDYKTKKDLAMTPGIQANYMLWSNRWEAFRAFVLKVPADSPVTGEQVERCITSYARQIVDARGGQPLVLRWASEAARLIVQWSLEHTRQFSKFTPPEVASMKRTLKWMLREKILTREVRYEKNTAGFGTSATLVRRYLSSTVLNDSLGPQPSARLLHVCGLVVLLVATAGRTGDLTLSGGYNHLEGAWQFLKYSDVQIQVAPPAQEARAAAVDDLPLIAELTLRAQKFHKFEKTQGNRSIRLSFDPSSSTLYMNPIIWIILLGLRSGALAGEKTYRDVIQAALARPNRQIEWAAGDRPLFHQFDTRCVPQYEKAATVHTTINAVHKFIRDSGVDIRVTPYSFRRGAIQDVQNLKDVPAHNERHAQQRAGHSHDAVRAGVTNTYTGDQRIDYSKLVDQQQHRLTDPFNRLAQAVNNATSTAKAAGPVPSLAATPGPAPRVPAGQATATTTTAAVFDEATQALLSDIEGLLQESPTATRQSLLEPDLVDDDDELWSAALAGVDGDVGQGAAAAAQPAEPDLFDDDDELWSAALAGVDGDDGQGAAAAAQPAEPDLIYDEVDDDDDDDEMWSAAFGGLAEEPLQPMHGLVDGSGYGEPESIAYGGGGGGGPTEGDFQPVQGHVDGNSYGFGPAAFGGTAEWSFQPVSGLVEGDGVNRGLGSTAFGLFDGSGLSPGPAGQPVMATHGPCTDSRVTQEPEFTETDIGVNMLLASPADPGECMIAQELKPEDESRLDGLRAASAFVDTMASLPDSPWTLGAQRMGPVDPGRYADCGGGTYRCLRCFRVYKYPAGHDKVCAASFPAELWETPTVDSAGVVTWTCKSCGRAVHNFASVRDHQQSCASTARVPPGYSRHGQGRDAVLICIRCRQRVTYQGTTNHNKCCLKKFDPTTWDISEAENLVTWTCMFCHKLLKSFPGVKTHLCAARKNAMAAQGVDGAGEQGVDGAGEQDVDGAGEQGVSGAGEQGVDGAYGLRRRCPYCPKSYLKSQKRVLEKHIRSAHPDGQVPADIDSHVTKPFQCPRGCKGRHERFTSQARLALHLREVHREGRV